MVFTDAKGVQADLIGVCNLVDQLTQWSDGLTARLLSSNAAAKLSIPTCISSLA